MRRVGDEVGFGELAAELVGAVAEHREDGPLVGQGAGGHRVGAVADPQRRMGGETDLGGATQLRLHHVRRLTGRKSTRLNSSHANISYAVFCLKKKKKIARSMSYGQKTTASGKDTS